MDNGLYRFDTGSRRGTENAVTGITSKDDESKLRGSRGVLYLLKEMGTFPRLLNLYSVLRPSVEDGNDVWGIYLLMVQPETLIQTLLVLKKLMYNPNGYNMLSYT